MKRDIQISAKGLGVVALLKFCPRCFGIWMKCRGKMPFQIFPGIFANIDSYCKKDDRRLFSPARESAKVV
jgi:hypothetical protein